MDQSMAQPQQGQTASTAFPPQVNIDDVRAGEEFGGLTVDAFALYSMDVLEPGHAEQMDWNDCKIEVEGGVIKLSRPDRPDIFLALPAGYALVEVPPEMIPNSGQSGMYGNLPLLVRAEHVGELEQLIGEYNEMMPKLSRLLE